MSEERERYVVGGRSTNRKALLAAENFNRFCLKFEQFSEREKEVFFDRIDPYYFSRLSNSFVKYRVKDNG